MASVNHKTVWTLGVLRMIRLIIILLSVVVFLILSIPVFFVEWVIGKFAPHARDISSLRIVQFMFKLILLLTGSKIRGHRRRKCPKGHTRPLHR